MQAERLQEGLQQTALWLVISLLLFGLGRLGWLSWLRSGGEWVTGGFTRTGEGVVREVKKPGKAVAFWFVGFTRLADLERRLADVVVDATRLRELEEENRSLRVLLNLSMEQGESGLLGELVAGAENRWLVSLGEREGVEEGMIVIDEQGALVGKIVSVGRFSSLIERPNTLGASMGVKILDKETQAVLEGEGAAAVLTGVLQEESLAIDDIVLTSGENGEYPPGLVVGQVVELTGRPSDVTKGAVVELLATSEGRVVVR